MFTIDRLRRLAAHYGLMDVFPKNFTITGYLDDDNNHISYNNGDTPIHAFIDLMDTQASIATRWADGHSCVCAAGKWYCAGNHNNQRYVGARLALHEELLARSIHKRVVARVHRIPFQKQNYSFWLGRDA